MADKYARDEYERRFLVEGELPQAEAVEEIEDRYLAGTRLRLRRMRTPAGPVNKLAKIVDVAPGHKKLTNLYLTPEEAELLWTLPGPTLRKTRLALTHAGRRWVVDLFPGGLRIAEVEHEPNAEVELPPWCGEEITARDDLSGFALASGCVSRGSARHR